MSDPDIEVFFRLHVLLYADDTIVMAETPEQLQKALNAVSDYCSQWNLTVNTSKTKIVIFSRGKVRRYPDFVFGSDKLDVVDEYVYLGVKFNYNGKYKKMIQKQITQARKALWAAVFTFNPYLLISINEIIDISNSFIDINKYGHSVHLY